VVHEATVHIELAHEAVALLRLQALPQALQLFGSLVVFTQRVPLQSMGVAAGQPVTHPEGEQTGAAEPQAVGVAAVLQPPQLAGCVMSVSQPFAGLPSQSAKPVLHDAMAQLEALQTAVAWAGVQATPQPPQLFVSLVVLTSQPVEASWSQSAKPVAHAATTQLEALQPAVACARLHAVAQEPQ
jgi:hypothetical protein